MFIKKIIGALSALAFVLVGGLAAAEAAEVEVLWLGHATTRITSTTGKVIVIDPFLKKNPLVPEKYKEIGRAHV